MRIVDSIKGYMVKEEKRSRDEMDNIYTSTRIEEYRAMAYEKI